MAKAEYNAEVKAVMDQVLTMPTVKAGSAFGYPAYKANGKIFAFVNGKGIIVKLPAERVQAEVAARKDAKVFEPQDGVFWKEWLSVAESDPQAFTGYQALLEESISYVTS